MELYSIDTGLFKLDGGAMFGVVPKSIWQKTNPADDNNLCTLAMRCLLVHDDDRLILIDTGVGHKLSDKLTALMYIQNDGALNQSLARHGFTPDDITDVFLTHLHLDHVGGAVERQGDLLAPAFKNAHYWTNQKHWDWATIAPNPREKASFLSENLLPLQQSGQLRFVEEGTGNTPFTTNMQIKFVSGHTESMMLPLLQYKGRTVFYVADLAPTTGHLPIPYVAAYDMFPLQAMQEKAALLQEAVDNNYVLFFEHDAVHECCTLQQTDKGIRVKNVFQLTDI